MKNNNQSRIKFLEQQLHADCIVDVSRYFGSSNTPKSVESFKEVKGQLNGINKNNQQQFDIDFRVGANGLTYYNCFGEFCRSWSHTVHAEHIAVLKRPLSSITDEEAIEVASFMGFKNGVNAAACRSLFLTLFVIKSNDPIKYEMISKQFLFDFMDIIVIGDKLRSFGFAIPFQDASVEQLIEYGWIKLI